jgi:hypothetical protein
LLVGAKHLEDKLSVIAKNSSPNASPVQLLVGAKHLEDKLSVIAKNSSPNASPVQLSVVSGKTITNYQLPITNYQLPITHYPLPITHYPLPIIITNNHYGQNIHHSS